MRKIIFFLLIIMTLILSSCQSKEETDTVKVWWYKQSDGYNIYNYTVLSALEEMEEYAQNNNIKLEITKFYEDILSYDDYILKRNAAVESGDVDILFDTVSNLYSLRNKNGDYTRLDTYSDILNSFKGYYCLPICYHTRAKVMNNEVLKLYDINCSKVISLDEYYEIKQRLRNSGAKFDFNAMEKFELVDRYYRKNNISAIEKDKKYTVDKDLLKQTVKDIYKDVMGNYNYTYAEDNSINKVYENNSGIVFSSKSFYGISSCDIYDSRREMPEELTDYTVAVIDKVQYEVKESLPCVFVTNAARDDAFKLASQLFTSKFQINLREKKHIYIMPVVDITEVKESYGLDSDWKCIRQIESYTPEDTAQLYDMKDMAYEYVVRGDNSYFFTDSRVEDAIISFIYDEVSLLMDNQGAFDSIDKRIDDLIININVHYN